MKKIPFLLLVLSACVLGGATVMERLYGTEATVGYVYGAAWFVVLWALIIAFLVWAIVQRRMWRKSGVMLLHAGFAVVFIAGMLTMWTRRSGVVHLRKHYPTREYVTRRSKWTSFPFLCVSTALR